MTRVHMFFLGVVTCAFAFAADVAGDGAETNVPPPSKLYIVGNGSANFLGFTNVYLTRRAEPTVALETHLGADHDDEGELLYFYWYDGDTVASNLPRYTNDYAQGLHDIHVAVSDNRDLIELHVPLEVISPLDAVRRLRADLELAGVRENIDRLRPLLRVAERSMERHKWSVSERRLKRFQNRLSVQIDNDTEERAALIERWNEAARRIVQSIMRFRKGDQAPSGVFPGPG